MSTWLEGWPLYAAIALVAAITWGALRPYLKGGKTPRKKDQTDER